MAVLAATCPRASASVFKLLRSLRLYESNGSPEAWRLLASHLWRRALGEPVPTFLDVAVTHRCPCRCVHCAAEAFRPDGGREFSTAELKSIVDQAKPLGVLEIILSGGEPLLRGDILELVRHIHDRGLLTRLNTNGLLLDRDRIEQLKEAGVTQCAVSIDSADAATHDALRGLPGLFEKAVSGIRNLRELGVPCQILTYASKQNVPDGLRGIADLGRRLGVLGVFIFFPMAVGRWDGDFAQVLSESERSQVRALQDMSLVHIELPSPRSVCCSHDRHVFYVAASGDVTPCPFVPFVIGNVRDRPLSELYGRYCQGLDLAYRGECPMNDPTARSAFRAHVESARRDLS